MRLKTENNIRPCGTCRLSFPATEAHFYPTSSGGLSSECRPCFRRRNSANQKVRHHTGGVAYHLAYITRSARARARKFSLTFDIDAEFVAGLLRDQGGRCALSGVTLTFTKGQGHITTNASLDRIDPRGGYTRGNVQLLANQVNTMKSNLDATELLDWCRLVLRHFGAPPDGTSNPRNDGKQ